MTSDIRDEIARVLGEHRSVFQCDGDYGEMQWVECTCGSEYYVDTDAGYAEHEAHLADALADLLAARDRRVRAEAWQEGHEWACEDIEHWCRELHLPANPYRADRIEAE